jgi:hypothetical protein
MLPEHPDEYVVVYPCMADDDTLYFPACNVTEVPEDEPANDAGFGLLPETVIVKSDGLLLPPDTLVVTINVANNPWGGVGKVETSGGEIFSCSDGGVGKVETSGGEIFSCSDGGVGQGGVKGGGIFTFAA